MSKSYQIVPPPGSSAPLRHRNPQAGEPVEVEIPAYEALRGNSRLAERILEILISGVSTRRYEPILPAMAGTVRVSKSQVSRVTLEVGERFLDDLAGHDFSGWYCARRSTWFAARERR
jgi:hypothetical protein